MSEEKLLTNKDLMGIVLDYLDLDLSAVVEIPENPDVYVSQLIKYQLDKEDKEYKKWLAKEVEKLKNTKQTQETDEKKESDAKVTTEEIEREKKRIAQYSPYFEVEGRKIFFYIDEED